MMIKIVKMYLYKTIFRWYLMKILFIYNYFIFKKNILKRIFNLNKKSCSK